MVPLEVIQSEEARELEAAQQALQEQQQQAAAARAAASAEQEAEQQRDKRRRQQHARRQRKAAAAAAAAAAAGGPDSDEAAKAGEAADALRGQQLHKAGPATAAGGPDSIEAAKPGEAVNAPRRRQQRRPSGGLADQSQDGAAQPAEGGNSGNSDAVGCTSDDAGVQERRSAAAAKGPNRGHGRARPKDVVAPGVRHRQRRLSGAGTPREQQAASAEEPAMAVRPRTAGRGSSGDLAAAARSSQPAVLTNGQRRPPSARPRTVDRGMLRHEQAAAAQASQSVTTRDEEAPACARLASAGRIKGQAAPNILTVARPRAAGQPNKPALAPAAASTSAVPATAETQGPAPRQGGVPGGQLG